MISAHSVTCRAPSLTALACRTAGAVLLALLTPLALPAFTPAAEANHRVETPTAIRISVTPRTVREDAGSKTVTVTAAFPAGSNAISRNTDVTVTVGVARNRASDATRPRWPGADYTTAGADFVRRPFGDRLTVTIPAGRTSGSATFTLTPTDNDVAEWVEHIWLRGKARGFGPLHGALARLTIIDDDQSVAVSATHPDPLTEADLNGARLTLDLGAARWARDLRPGHFTLSNAVPGLSVWRVDRVGVHAPVLTLAHDGSDLAADAQLTVTVAAAATSHTASLTTPAVTVRALRAPDAPANVRATPDLRSRTPGQVAVTWDPVADADGYKVQWKSGSQSYDAGRQNVVVGGATAAGAIRRLTSGTAYTVRVLATRAAAPDSAPSAEASVCAGVAVPAAPTGLRAVGGSRFGGTRNDIRFDWDDAPAAGFKHYEVGTRTLPSGAWTHLANLGNRMGGTDITAGPNEDRELRVRTVNTCDIAGPWSHTTVYRPTQAAAPSVSTDGVRAESGAVRLAWTAPASQARITGYAYRHKLSSAGNDGWTLVEVNDPAARSAKITGLTDNESYDYQVRADHAGRLGWFSGSTTKTFFAPPSAPLLLSTRDTTEDAISFGWAEPSNWGAAFNMILMTGRDYRYEWKPSTATGWEGREFNSNTRSVTVTGLSPGTTYDFRVRAKNRDRDGAFATTIQGTTDPPGTTDPAPVEPAFALGTLDPAAVPEGGAATYTVTLTVRPTRDVPINIASDNTDVTVSPSSLTFTPSNWDTAQTVTVRADEDADAADEAATLTHSDGVNVFVHAVEYDRVSAELAVTVADNDAPGVRVGTLSSAAVPEGGSATWTVALEAQPTAKVVVDVRSDNADVTVYPSALDFSPTDWDMPRTVTVTAAEDGDSLDDVAALTHAVRDAESAGEYADVSAVLDVTVADNDVRELVLGTLAPVPEGGATTYTARLSVRPSADVTVEIASDNRDVAAAPASLTFTPSNWNRARTVTVSAAQDGDTADDVATLTHRIVDAASAPEYRAVADARLAVTVEDDDTSAQRLIRIAPTTVSEGDGTVDIEVIIDLGERFSQYYAVWAEPAPSTRSTFQREGYVRPGEAWDFSGGHLPDGQGPSIRFTTGPDGVFTHRLRLVLNDDTEPEFDEAVLVRFAMATVPHGRLTFDETLHATLTIADNDGPQARQGETSPNRTAGVTVSAADPLTVAEGGSSSYTVVLDAEPTGDVVIAMTSDNADVTAEPASLTFTAENWQTAQVVTVSAAQDGDAADDAATLSHAASGADGYAGIAVASVNVAVADDDAAGVTVSKTELSLEEGGEATYTVVLDTQPVSDVDIVMSSSHGVTVQPASLTFTPENWDTARTVTVSAPQDDNVADEEATVIHSIGVSPGSAYAGVVVPPVTVSVTDDDAATSQAQRPPWTLRLVREDRPFT
ncbi:MAG: fibronectin type III domain-containing protein, partial [Boseongicola sp.]|nr:fibronectin type III domain-containing protein [Boseongicola sp.]